MAGYQFIHIETYARSPSSLTGAKRAEKGTKREGSGVARSARDVLGEALREQGRHPHVPVPGVPEELIGGLGQLADELDELDKAPPKGQRKDAAILLAGVVSAPWPAGDERGVLWAMDTMTFLKKEFGDALCAVARHADEKHDHLHFYVRKAGWSNVKDLHPGLAARAAVKAEQTAADPKAKQDGKAQSLAFNEAMRAFQDRYHDQVGMEHGLARIGPKKRRLTRLEWQTEKKQADALVEARKEADQVIEKARFEAAGVARSTKSKKLLFEDQITQRMKALDERERKVAEAEKHARLVFESMTPDAVVTAAEKFERLTAEKAAVERLKQPTKAPDEVEAPRPARRGFSRP